MISKNGNFRKLARNDKFRLEFTSFYFTKTTLLVNSKLNPKEYPFIGLFQNFIEKSRSGKRLQPNGKRIREGTINSYVSAEKLLSRFCQEKSYSLRIREEISLTKREREREHLYWKRFYAKYSSYLHDDLKFFDNYTGHQFKVLKTFFNYLNKETPIKPGFYHRQFYVRKEQIPIFALLPEELRKLVSDVHLEEKLSRRLKETKDVFVFGCTVALRVGDLVSLSKRHLKVIDGSYYLAVRSQKTSTDTLVKLPSYCVSILQKYRFKGTQLLPRFNKSNLNKSIKKLLEAAGFVQEVDLTRERRGETIRLSPKAKKKVRFCDVASTHTMRRTAITTMLCLGMPEQVVRKISGHAPGTKEFFRYVLIAQAYLDQEADKVYRQIAS